LHLRHLPWLYPRWGCMKWGCGAWGPREGGSRARGVISRCCPLTFPHSLLSLLACTQQDIQYIFYSLFVAEALIKITGLGLKGYVIQPVCLLGVRGRSKPIALSSTFPVTFDLPSIRVCPVLALCRATTKKVGHQSGACSLAPCPHIPIHTYTGARTYPRPVGILQTTGTASTSLLFWCHLCFLSLKRWRRTA